MTAPEQMPTMTLTEIADMFERSKDDTEIFVGSEIRILCVAARRGVEAESEIATLRERLSDIQQRNGANIERLNRAETALITALRERGEAAEDAAKAWGIAIEWLQYASEFQEKLGLAADKRRYDAARKRLEVIHARAAAQDQLKGEKS